jgi:hypothetical protein
VIRDANTEITDVSNDPPINTERFLAVFRLINLFKYRCSNYRLLFSGNLIG